jgi:hypothetical protein
MNFTQLRFKTHERILRTVNPAHSVEHAARATLRRSREIGGIRSASGGVSAAMRRRIVAFALAGGLVLAACGGGAPPAPVADDGATVTLPTPEPGPIPDLPVAAASVTGSPLPAIAVRQINGDGGWVQFRNELPAETPLLVWFWAPH